MSELEKNATVANANILLIDWRLFISCTTLNERRTYNIASKTI